MDKMKQFNKTCIKYIYIFAEKPRSRKNRVYTDSGFTKAYMFDMCVFFLFFGDDRPNVIYMYR